MANVIPRISLQPKTISTVNSSRLVSVDNNKWKKRDIAEAAKPSYRYKSRDILPISTASDPELQSSEMAHLVLHSVLIPTEISSDARSDRYHLRIKSRNCRTKCKEQWAGMSAARDA